MATGRRNANRIEINGDRGAIAFDSPTRSLRARTTCSSWAVSSRPTAPIEAHGVDGSLIAADPNNFAGDVQLHARGGSWETLEPSAGYIDSGRGIGLLDLVAGDGRARGALALHVLEIMTALAASAHGIAGPSRSTGIGDQGRHDRRRRSR